MARNRVVAFSRADKAHVAFDMLRTKVARSAHEENWRSLGITAPTSGCGKATVALNLAMTLAKQQDFRVVLMDLDLRSPRIATMLGHEPICSMEEFLTSGWLIEEFFVRVGENLAIGASSESMAHPAELLLNRRTRWTLKRLQNTLAADIVIYNLPPMLLSDDCNGFLPQVDRTMLVVGAEQSTISEIDVCERELAAESKLLGVVLNKCKHSSEQYGNYGV